MEDIIDIHPLDLGDILNRMEMPELTICEGLGRWRTEIVEVQGKVYRQTVDVPVTSAYGKALLKEIGGVDI